MAERKPWTAADRARHRQVRERFRDQPTIDQLVASGELSGQTAPLGVYLAMREVGGQLRHAREAAGLSLADLSAKTGIDKAALSRLESGKHVNPTLATLARYAAALGKSIHVQLKDEAA